MINTNFRTLLGPHHWHAYFPKQSKHPLDIFVRPIFEWSTSKNAQISLILGSFRVGHSINGIEWCCR